MNGRDDWMWPKGSEEGIRQSRIDARDIARARREKRRKEIISALAWCAFVFIMVYIMFWAAFG